MTTRRGLLALAAVGVAALSLIAIEFGLGAVSFGQPRLADPCTATAGASGGGPNGVLQRFVRATLNGAACELHTTREELVLSFVPAGGTKRIRWSKQTIDRALQAGLNRAAHTLGGSGIVGDALALTLTQLAAPAIESLLQGGK